MDQSAERAVAIVGVGAILPDAPNAPAYWRNIREKRYSIIEVPPERWSVEDYYDPDPNMPDKTYSRIGAWVQGFEFDWKRYRIPPRVAAAMDEGQQWAVAVAEEVLADFGYPNRPLDLERTGVILGTAMGGELHYLTHLRASFPEYTRALASVSEFRQLPADVRRALLQQWREEISRRLPPITEDSMPGELPNIVAGRVANVFNLRGPSFITDAACASSFAAIDAAVQLLIQHRCDAVLSGGIDRNMGASTFVKFCKIGALSATGTRPFGDRADGFVMGEGAAIFLLKRLVDAERHGDRIYAVIRGVGGSSDGKGKGITAPNPIGQQLAVSRAWENAGLEPATATLIEAHGTSTRVGDVVEVESLAKVFGAAPRGRIALGSAKSNIGHLKAGAGAAGLLKTVMALYDKVLPPTLNAEPPNPNIDFASTPFSLNHDLQEWSQPPEGPRRAGVSAYGFGGTNFHLVLEEHVPGALTNGRRLYAGGQASPVAGGERASEGEVGRSGPAPLPPGPRSSSLPSATRKPPVRGILVVSANSASELIEKVGATIIRAREGWVPPQEAPNLADLRAPERLVVDFGSPEELLDRLATAQKAFGFDTPAAWKALQAQGIFRGSGPAGGKIAFLFPGQGSQYVNMGRELAALEPAVAGVFAEADRVMEPILGKPLTSFIFVDSTDPQAVTQAELGLMQTAITQPAMLTMDIALYKLLADYGFKPDIVMGHSLGEYAALIASGIMPLADALEAAAARGREMTRVSVDDTGWMAAVMAPYDVVHETLAAIDGYVVAANINSTNQCVIGGASETVEQAIAVFQEKGYQAQRIPVSHAFHTKIVAPASRPLRQVLNRLHIAPPQLPLVANVTGDFYPTTVEGIKDILEQQIASPVQWVKGLQTLYDAGVRTFVEVGPKKALKGFVDDVLGSKPDVVSLFANHPKTGELPAFNHLLCGLYAAGHGQIEAEEQRGREASQPVRASAPDLKTEAAVLQSQMESTIGQPEAGPNGPALNQLILQSLQGIALTQHSALSTQHSRVPYDRNEVPLGSVVISGTGLGLPGAEKSVMDPENARRVLRGEQLVDLIPARFRTRMLAKRITRLVKSEDGSGRFETITDPGEVIKLAGRPGSFDLTEEYGVPQKLVEALDITTQLAMAAGLDALREAGLPLVQTYRRTSKGTYLPDRWLLPDALRDETGVIFASAFPGGDRFADEFTRYYRWENRCQQLEMLEDLRLYTHDADTLSEINRRIGELRAVLEREPYTFDRRFIFRILAMGHSQLAEYIGARGPNTHVNAACASTTQAVALAEDWIRSGRCRRVLVVAADDVTGDNLMEWVGAGFLATGAAATDDRVEEAALPFDRRRHGTLLGMGACALVVESEDAVRERGMRAIAELLSSESCNSAFHGTRLDVDHIAQVMNNLVTTAERRFGLDRRAIAPHTVFMSHETFTPARGGSASSEVVALRHTFGDAASELIVANTKGFTGHPMGVGIEDVIAVKILEYGIVPPVPNYKEVDPDLGPLTLSRGGRYPVQYALHLAAGFGSQIAMTLTRRVPGALDRVDNKGLYQRWLADVSGYERAELEVIKRVLRVKAQGAPMRVPAPSSWVYGTGPAVRAPAFGSMVVDGARPAPLVVPAQPSSQPVIQPAPGPVAIQPGGQQPAPSDGQTPPATGNGRSTTVPRASVEPASARVEPAGAPGAVALEPGVAPAPAVAGRAQPAGVEPGPLIAAALDSVTAKVLQIVAEKTGYPVDMLDLDLDLEADLGIDTVKQAETFVAIRTAFDIPRREDLKLRDYPTLAHVVGFVREMRHDLAQPSPQPTVPRAESATPAAQHSALNSEPSTPGTQGATDGPDPITAQVLAIVAEKTGYPTDMLDLDLDLEADLGIDTVKQAETFVAIRTAFDIPRREDLKLRDYPTLAHVVGFVHENRPDLAQPSPQLQVPGAEPAPPGTQNSELRTQNSTLSTPYSLEDADRIPRRVPVPVLRPPIDLCKPTGVALDASSRVIVMMDRGGVGKALVNRLEKRGVTMLVIDEPPTSEALEAQVKVWRNEGPITGVYWLAALDVEPDLEALDLEGWREANRVRVKNLYTTMRALYEAGSDPSTFLLAATRLGGLHGYDDRGATAPLGGAVVGFTKAYKRERASVVVKIVDFEPGRTTAEPAEALLAETLADPGVVEVGYRDGLRYTVGLDERPAADGQPGMTLGKEMVFVVTGAAGGITSAIVSDLAGASGGIFYLLDLVPAPRRDDPDIALFRTDKEALKQKLIDTIKAAGERPTPVKVEKQMLAIERQEAARRAIESVEAAGGTARYHSINLLDAPAVTAVINGLRQRHGRIDVLLHAAGLEISRALPEKEPREFDLVFDVKADGFFNLLRAAKGLPIGATIAFSSVAGRFGNSGQTDYSAANDLLCKVTSSMRRWRPETRGIVIDWTAWGGIGMATRGSIPKIMEMAGIDMLPPECGVPTIRRELTSGGTRGELVVGQRLGILTQEWDETGGLDTEKVTHWLAERERPLLMIGTVKAARLDGRLEVETTLDPQIQPFLFDHQFEGTPLLPGVMGTETFAELASLLAPGYAVAAVENEQFLSPFKFYHQQPRTLYLSARISPATDGDLVARATLRSVTKPARPEMPVQEKTHFTADVRLTRRFVEPPVIPFEPPAADTLPIRREQVYRIYFHGPAYQVLDRARVDGETAVGLMAERLPANSSPDAVSSLMVPRLIELCFQTAGIWQIATQGTLALPMAIRSVTTYRQLEESDGRRLYALVTAVDGGKEFNAQVVDDVGNVYTVLNGYRTVQLPGRLSLE